MTAPSIPSSVESLLRERTGISADLIGNLAGCVSRRMHANGIDDEGRYLSLLSGSGTEQEELIEEVLVPETWFFRDSEPFAYLKKYVLEKKSACTAQDPVRVLSIPASTGEEPYSIAITLMEAGLEPDQFSVLAVDISRRALEKAKAALYAECSFKQTGEQLRRKYFENSGSMHLVVEKVRNTVRFERGNVLEQSALGPYESCDIVFFRNLLIYLDEESRKRAIQNVGRVLKKGGLLVLGYAEPQHLFFPGYAPVDHRRSYASLKPDKGVEKEKKSYRASDSAAFFMKRPEPAGKVQPVRADNAKIEKARAELPERPSVILAHARELADAGMLSDAEELAEKCITSDAACVEAHYLLAVTSLARGDDKDAIDRLNRVIYLDPNHNDALLHISLVMDRLGHKDQAARYRKRISRLGKET
jgi:chemotaxis protein methyltransferase WspC